MMKEYVFPYTYSEDVWIEHEGSLSFPLSDEEARELLQACRSSGKLFEDLRGLRSLYDAILEAATEKIRQEVTGDPEVVKEWIQDLDPDFSAPITEVLIDQFMEALTVRVFYPEAFSE